MKFMIKNNVKKCLVHIVNHGIASQLKWYLSDDTAWLGAVSSQQ